MDDLDRLAFRVARTVRTTYPQLLEHGFTLSDLEERLAPYPETRREMAASGPDGYEQTVLRLLAGERGYLTAEPELQEACRRALQMASPTVSIVRTWAGSTLTLRGTAFSLGNERTTGGGDETQTRTTTVSRGAPESGRLPSGGTFAAANDHAHQTRRNAQRAADADNESHGGSAACACHFCGGTLPANRSITFCPFCGLDLTVRHCPACSAELQRTWRFCVSCGRQSEDEVLGAHIDSEADADISSAAASSNATHAADAGAHTRPTSPAAARRPA